MNNENSKATVMVVDDTPANLKLLEEMLQGRGYRVVQFPRGAMALKAAAKNPPDLILLDIMMPEMDGFEVCRRLKVDEILKDIPVLFISALDGTDDKVKAFSAGGLDYVTKPFQEEEVLARVEIHLRLRSLQRQLSEQNENLEWLVAERTRDLAKAYERLQEVDRLKNDFFCMISHEIRTPANGVLGVGHMILELCPDSEDGVLAADLFTQSALRLQNLIDDATLIVDMEALALESGEAMSFESLLDNARTSLPEIEISIEQQAGAASFFPRGFPPLLKKSLKSTILLAASFSGSNGAVDGTAMVEEQVLRVQFKLDALSLSEEQAADFFKIESRARSASSAESLGLAPVVAHQIITTFGGAMQLIKGEGDNGYLEVVFSAEPGGAGRVLPYTGKLR